MGMGETEINLVVVVDVPVQTPHDLIRRSFQRVSLITSRIIVVFFRQVLADVVHPHKGTAAYRCGVLERTVHDAVRLEVCSSGMIEISMPIMEEYLKMYGCTLLINYTRPCLYTVIYRLQGLTSMHPILR